MNGELDVMKTTRSIPFIPDLASHLLSSDNPSPDERPIIGDRTVLWILALCGLLAAWYGLAVWYPSIH